MRKGAFLLALLLLLAVGVLFLDVSLSPEFLLPTAPYSVSILVAAYLLPPNRVVWVTLWTMASLLVAAYFHQSPALEVVLDLVGLVAIGCLGATLSSKMRREVTMKLHAERMAEDRQQSINTLHTLIDTIPVGVVVTDSVGAITLANPVAKDLMEAVNANPPQGPWQPMPAGTPFPPGESPVLRALRSGESITNLEMLARGGDNSDRVLLAAASPVRDEGGGISGAVAVLQDITELKQVEAEKAQLANHLQLILASTDEGICGIDLHGQCSFVNSSAARILGYQPEELLGRDLHGLIHHTRADGTSCPRSECPIFQSLDVGRGVRVTDELLWRRDGSSFPVEYSSYPIVEGSTIRGAVITFTDISERKEVEKALSWESGINAAVAELSEALISAATIEEISSLVLERAKQLTGSRFGFVGHIDTQTGWLVSSTLTGEVFDRCGTEKESIQFKEFKGLWGWVLGNRKPLLTNNPSQDPRSCGVPDGHIPIRNFVSAPALIGQRLVGQLALANSERGYAERDLRLVERLATLYAIAVQRNQVVESLRESESRYSSLFEDNSSVMLLIDPESGSIVDANPAACDFYGWNREELSAMRITDINTLPGEQTHAEMGRARSRQRTQFYFKHRLACAEVRDVEVHSGPIEVKGRQLLYSIIHDISDRRRAEEERERLLVEVERRMAELDATITSIADAVLIYDPAGEILRMNPAAEQLFGYSDAERQLPMERRFGLLRLTTAEGEPFSMDETPSRRALRGDTVQGTVMRIGLPSGRQIWTSASAAPILGSDGTLVGAIATFADVTPLRELQAQQEDVLRTVSHDLRSPLAAIQGHAQMLEWALKRADGGGKELRSAEAILRSARQMNRMIGELVDIIRLEAGRLELRREPVDLCEFLDDLLQRNAPHLQVDRIKLRVGVEMPRVVADPDRLERVLMNLLSNALKYSTADTEVGVRASLDENDVLVSVENQGKGIDPADMPHLFERFYQSRGNRSSDSVGLGLYTARILVEAHGGEIWAESTPGEVTIFSFSLPLFRPEGMGKGHG